MPARRELEAFARSGRGASRRRPRDRPVLASGAGAPAPVGREVRAGGQLLRKLDRGLSGAGLSFANFFRPQLVDLLGWLVSCLPSGSQSYGQTRAGQARRGRPPAQAGLPELVVGVIVAGIPAAGRRGALPGGREGAGSRGPQWHGRGPDSAGGAQRRLRHYGRCRLRRDLRPGCHVRRAGRASRATPPPCPLTSRYWKNWTWSHPRSGRARASE